MTTELTAIAPQAEARVSATPYARRLARERGLALAMVAGTGPNGRRTGRDVLAHAPTSVSAPPTAAIVTPPAPAARSGSAAAGLAASVSLEAIAGLLPQFDGFEPAIELVDVCLKAAAAALRGSPPWRNAAIVLTGRAGVMDGLDRLTLGAIAALRHEGADGAPVGDRPVLEVSWLPRDGIRPIALPLGPGTAARVLLAGTTTPAECLLSYDPGRIEDLAAADFLLAFKGLLEAPLRMIA